MLSREKYKNVIFLYVSDDLQWGKTTLEARNLKHGDLYFVGEGSGKEISR